MTHRTPNRKQDEIRFTQNFLRDPALVAKLISQANIRVGDRVLEIGPGKGIITQELAKAVGSDGLVVAVELDPGLATQLAREFALYPRVQIVAGDILSFDLASMQNGYKVFANVPFNITSALLEHLFYHDVGPSAAHLILQTDALTGIGEQGVELETFKSLLIKPLYTIEVEYRFRRTDFNPPPSVDTSLFGFERRVQPLIDPTQYSLYKDFLAFVSRDRVGEGVWLRVLSRRQIDKLAEHSGLAFGRGIKLQSIDAVAAAFHLFASDNKAKQGLVSGAMTALRDEQARREDINRAGGHRRPRRT